MATDNSGEEMREFDELQEKIRGFCSSIFVQPGHLIWTDGNGKFERGRKPNNNDTTYHIEHFGFHDSISNPRFLRLDVDNGRFRKSIRERPRGWNPFARLSLVLSEETPHANSYGSYLVFKRFEQDVPGFVRAIRLLALQFKVDSKAKELAEDMFQSNPTAITKKWKDDYISAIAAEFEQEHGARCERLKIRRAKGEDRFRYPMEKTPKEVRESLKGRYKDRLKRDPKFRELVWSSLKLTLSDAKAAEDWKVDVERAGAMVIGRHRNGKAVFNDVKSLADCVGPTDPNTLNDFDFSAEDAMAKCPYHAHMRRMNPRMNAQRPHRIVRRSMLYGDIDRETLQARHDGTRDLESYQPQQINGGGGRGLLFMSYQADLDSFEMLEDSADDRDFYPDARQKGIDPLIGRKRDTQEWPRPGEKDEITRFPFRNYVIPKGGAYFFAPSIEFLDQIETFSTREEAKTVAAE
jgi:deferrochelatase/peroxidase EfeB